MTRPLIDGALDDHTILFLGESTLRYLYLTVLNLLQTSASDNVPAAWQGCQQRCFWNEHTWPSWADFFDGTSIGDANFCDCYRAQGRLNYSETMENRYNHVGRTKFAFVSFYGIRDLPTFGTWRVGDPDTLRKPHATWAPRWEMQIDELCRTLLPSLRPSVILVNFGHHLAANVPLLSPYKDAELDEMYARIARPLHAITPNVVWTTTIVNHQFDYHSVGVRREQALVGRHFNHVFNASESIGSMTTEHFIDKYIHLKAHGNALLACRLTAYLDLLHRTPSARRACQPLGQKRV